MALTSPGVEVTIIDQSQYLPAPTNSVPLVVLATAQNKADASGTGVAAATTAANAGKLYQVTSQRDLVNLYGTPFFYTTTNGTPIQGYELNEYGLLAAYSLLGVTNRCYVLRADIDLASLVGQTGRPTGAAENGEYWLDSTESTWGIYEFNQTTGRFTEQIPIVITDPADLSANLPLASIGNIGDYAVNSIQATTAPINAEKTYFHKTTTNQWVVLGSRPWKENIPTIQGTNNPPTLTAGDTLTLNSNGAWSITVAVPTAPNNTVQGLSDAISAFGLTYLSSYQLNGRLNIFSDQPQSAYVGVSGTSGLLTALGIEAKNYYQPLLQYGTSAQMPLWTSSQATPRPTGSVWIKVGSSGNGLAPVMSVYNSTTASWNAKNVGLYTSDWDATAVLDSTGGQTIPVDTIYSQYYYDNTLVSAPLYFWKRIATGATVVTGTATNPNFNPSVSAGSFVVGKTYTILSIGSTNFTSLGAASNTVGIQFTATGTGTGGVGVGTASLYFQLSVQVSVPGSSSLSTAYTVTLPSISDATDFVTAWSAASIPFTTASVTTDGAIQLTHTEGGEIMLNDFSSTTGISNGLLNLAGFVEGTTDGCKYGSGVSTTFTNLAQYDVVSSSGSGARWTVTSSYSTYIPVSLPTTAGTGYAIGDIIIISGAALGGIQGANDLYIEITTVNGSGGVTGSTYYQGSGVVNFMTQLSNWREFTYTANEGAPVSAPANNTNWFYSVTNQVDIMVNYNGGWKGYGTLNYDNTGFPTSGSNTTDPNGPIIAATAPTTQSDGTALVYGDLWVSTADLENYPVISRWELVDDVDQWVLLDNSDQTSSNGILFADARWATSGSVNPANDPIPSIAVLLDSNYIDLDCPTYSSYPNGMLLFNTRRSGYNVKQYRVNYFNSTSFPGQSLPTERDAWVSTSGLQSNGSPYMGRKAQRAMVVQSLRSVVDTNLAIRDEDNFFNLIATPNYCELQPNMVVLNADRGETAYILGDTPMRLADSATDIQAWATNAAGATATSEEGLVTRNTYMGLFYPSGITSDLSGNLVAVPASHMMLRTFLRNDTISYPWLAAAGTRRGTIDNATNIGYIDATTGEFQTIKTRLGIRDVLYINFINPLVFFTGIGLLNYGNKTSFNSTSALDRTNVDRLVAYIRRQLTIAARPFVFEPNDALTRQQIAGVIESLMIDLVAKRGIYDYLVVCDDSNNTPARIDRNELWVDVAIEPVKAAEFIYIPVRVLNTGELSQ
jgi:hypothetical protein